MAESSLASHKGCKLSQYTFKFKIEAINYAAIHGFRPASRKFSVDERRIREWSKKKEKIISMVNESKHASKRQRLPGAGKKPLSVQLEEVLLSWVYSRRERGLRVSGKLTMKKAKLIFCELKPEESSEDIRDEQFQASRGWLQNFMRRNHLSFNISCPERP